MKRFDYDAIEILVYTINQETEKLLRVMLIRSVVLGLQLTNRSLQTKDEKNKTKQMTIYTLKSIGVRYGRSPPHIS